MNAIATRSQKEDPNGLLAVSELLNHGTADDFEDRVLARRDEIKRLKTMLTRSGRFCGVVELSPYVKRMLSVVEQAEERESARLAAVGA